MTAPRPRRVEYSESTRQALVDSALVLFTEQGYAGTSLDEIASRARVTKGALYHHFAGKQALFEAAFESVEAGVVRRLAEAMSAVSGDPWERVREGLQAFLNVCLDASFQRIVAQEGPVVMGFQRWREADEKFTYRVVRESVANLVEAGEIEPLPVDALSRIMFGALATGAETIANSADPKQTSVEVGQCVQRVLSGLRTNP